MPRNKKMRSEEMVAIVDEFYEKEAKGDASRLMCSKLEAYAAVRGYPVKAYDFRRDKGVRTRIEQLKAMERHPCTGGRSLMYKDMDVLGMLRMHSTPEEMAAALNEINSHWKEVYEESVRLSKSSRETQEKLLAASKELEECRASKEESDREARALRKENRKLTGENRYLKAMLRTYLYPAVANQILSEEGVIKDPDTRVTGHAMEDIAEGRFPDSFSGAAKRDREALSRAEAILKTMEEAADA